MQNLMRLFVCSLALLVAGAASAWACHEEKPLTNYGAISGHKPKFSINYTTVSSTEEPLAMTAVSTSCDWYTSFLYQKYDNVAENAAQGEGPFLNVIAAFQGCLAQWHQEFGVTVRARYGEVFDETSRQEPEVLMGRIQQVIESHPQLQQACNEV